MKETLLQRIQELRQALEQSAQQHNALIGRMAETQFLYDQLVKKEEVAKALGEQTSEPVPAANCD